MMDAVEHSRLIYLIEAIGRAPDHAPWLLTLAKRPSASRTYRKAWSRLHKVRANLDKLLLEREKLRLEMR